LSRTVSSNVAVELIWSVAETGKSILREFRSVTCSLDRTVEFRTRRDGDGNFSAGAHLRSKYEGATEMIMRVGWHSISSHNTASATRRQSLVMRYPEPNCHLQQERRASEENDKV